MRRRDDAEIAFRSGLLQTFSLETAHADLVKCSGQKSCSVGRADEESADIRGPTDNFRAATAHAVVAMLWALNSFILLIAAAEIEAHKGGSCFLRWATDHAKLKIC